MPFTIAYAWNMQDKAVHFKEDKLWNWFALQEITRL